MGISPVEQLAEVQAVPGWLLSLWLAQHPPLPAQRSHPILPELPHLTHTGTEKELAEYPHYAASLRQQKKEQRTSKNKQGGRLTVLTKEENRRNMGEGFMKRIFFLQLEIWAQFLLWIFVFEDIWKANVLRLWSGILWSPFVAISLSAAGPEPKHRTPLSHSACIMATISLRNNNLLLSRK